MTEDLHQVVAEWLENVRPEHRDDLARLHQILTEIEPEFSIKLKWSQPTYSVGGQMIAYLADQKDYVHLGFYNGAQFEDPHGLIDGTGKRLRHIKVSTLDGELEKKLRDTVKASLAAGSEYAG